MPEPTRARGRLAALFGFSTFFVFPAVPIGRTGAITIALALAAALALWWVRSLRASDWAPVILLLAPAALAGWYVIAAGSAIAPDVVPKSVVATAMSLLVVVPALRLLRDGHGEALVLGAAWATLVHAAAGAHQVLAFERLEFPFAALMRTNPAQALLTQDPDTYAMWVKRPFGLFAEPSAMAACLGPWLVVITTALFSPSGARSRARTALLGLALASGLWLVLASQSGLSAAIVAGTVITALGTGLGWRGGVGGRVAAVVLAAAVAVTSATWLAGSSRFDLGDNASWQARLESLQLGARTLADSIGAPGRLLGGVGPGQTYTALSSTALRYDTAGGVTAVWSVGLNYALETGVLGVAAMLLLAGWGVRAIWASRQRLAGAAFGAVWLTGVFAATSYVGQPALWTALAALLSWGSLVGDARGRATRDATGRRPEAGGRSEGAEERAPSYSGTFGPSTLDA